MFATIAPSESERYLSPGAGEQPEGREEPARVGTMPGHPTGHSIRTPPERYSFPRNSAHRATNEVPRQNSGSLSSQLSTNPTHTGPSLAPTYPQRPFSRKPWPLLACLPLLLWGSGPRPDSAAVEGSDGIEVLYVANRMEGTISVIQVPSFEVIGKFDALPDIPADQRPEGGLVYDLVASSMGEVLYVARDEVRDVAAFSTATEELLWRLPVGGIADHMALSHDGRYLFVSVISESHAVVIDTVERAVVGKIHTGIGPHGMHMSPDGNRVYNGCILCDQITIADASTFEVIRTIQFDEGVLPFAVTADEETMFIQLTKLHGFVVLDLETDHVAKTIHLPVPDGVEHMKTWPHTAHHGLALTPDETRLCLASTVGHYVGIVSVQGLDLLATIPIGREPYWVTASLDSGYCYASARYDDNVSIISLAEEREVARLELGDYPFGMLTVRIPERQVGR